MNARSSTSRKPKFSRFPTNPPNTLSPNASEYPHNTHTIVTTPIMMNDCMIVAPALFVRTNPE